METQFSLFYVTFPDAAIAEQICQILLEEQLIACANLLPNAQSMYWWQGQIQKSKETIGILKTKSAYRAKLQNRLTSLHPYETLCCLEIPIQSANADYLQYLKTNLF